jgi:hypothetical protein
MAAALSPPVFAAQACEEKIAFAKFFQKFSDEAAFQKSRVAPIVRIGKWVTVGRKDSLVWSLYSRADLLPSPASRVLPPTETQKKLYTATSRAVRAGVESLRLILDESDSYDTTFTFELRNGCWLLVELRDDIRQDDDL